LLSLHKDTHRPLFLQSNHFNEAELGVAKTNIKDKSPNIFGEMTEAERWAKV